MENFQYSHLTFENGIARIVLNRSAKANALNQAFVMELLQLLTKCEQDAEIKVIVLEALGKTFCAGMDLTWDTGAVETLQVFFKRLFVCPKPLLACVEGNVYGGGIGILACCDIVLASESIQLRFPEVALGLAPALISPYVIQAMGVRKAIQLILTGELFSARVAYEAGLIHVLFSPEQKQACLQHYQTLFAGLESRSLQINKALLKHYQHISPETEVYTEALLNRLLNKDQ